MSEIPKIVTVGHGTTPAPEFAALLHQASVTELIDVRTAPGSRRNPQFAQAEMQHWLPENKIGYRWEQRLGGWRKVAPDSPDIEIRHPSFRAYAGHMRSSEFLAGIADVLDLAQHISGAVALMCSETVWWRCHRRMIADYLVLVRELPVHNLMPGGKLPAHSPMPAARVTSGPAGPELIYDVPPPAE